MTFHALAGTNRQHECEKVALPGKPGRSTCQRVTPHSHDLGKHVSFKRLAASLRICHSGDSTHSRHFLDSFILHHFSNFTKYLHDFMQRRQGSDKQGH